MRFTLKAMSNDTQAYISHDIYEIYTHIYTHTHTQTRGSCCCLRVDRPLSVSVLDVSASSAVLWDAYPCANAGHGTMLSGHNSVASMTPVWGSGIRLGGVFLVSSLVCV